MSFGNLSGWIKCWLLTMALMEIMDNHHHHHRRRQYIYTYAWSKLEAMAKRLKLNFTSLWEEGECVSFQFCCLWFSNRLLEQKRHNLNDPNLLKNKLFRLFRSGAIVMVSIDALGNQALHLHSKATWHCIKIWLDGSWQLQMHWILRHLLMMSDWAGSCNRWMYTSFLQSAGQLEWKR
jgi:hypothetical protein